MLSYALNRRKLYDDVLLLSIYTSFYLLLFVSTDSISDALHER